MTSDVSANRQGSQQEAVNPTTVYNATLVGHANDGDDSDTSSEFGMLVRDGADRSSLET